MYWCGMIILCGEHELQTTLPHFLQHVRHLRWEHHGQEVGVDEPAVMFAHEETKLRTANRTVGHLSIGLPSWDRPLRGCASFNLTLRRGWERW